MATFFNEYFGVERDVVDDYGAFNVSIINDLPLFIDPFLLFHSGKAEYQQLHAGIIDYMVFLKDAVAANKVTDDLLKSWFMFPEVKQNWLGFSMVGNGGTGLGPEFATALRKNLRGIFADFGTETISHGSHVEKVCLIRSGIGRDNISDFTTNLLMKFLCEYTQTFARAHIEPNRCKEFWINKAWFSYETESWVREKYFLPAYGDDFVLLTPKDLLTRDENWINRTDMIRDFQTIPIAISDAQLRGQITNYFERQLARPRGKPISQREKDEAAARTLLEFPQLIDYFIRLKEEQGDNANDLSAEKVAETAFILGAQIERLQAALSAATPFYQTPAKTYEESHQRLAYLKDVVENKGGHRFFYDNNGKPFQRESDVQILYLLTWYGTPSDAGREANDGRGPVDFKISRGKRDKTLVEFKLAKNSRLEQNLQKQLEIYQAASDAKHGIKAIVYFSIAEKRRVEKILKKLKMTDHPDVVLIDARDDNKPSASKA